MLRAVPAMLMRGGTSKGLYFLARDLPADEAARNAVLRRMMGSPDRRQIDGIGGAHPLTSKVAIVSPSDRPGIDVDYLFLQVTVETGEVKDTQNCGNILAGVGHFALERGVVTAQDDHTEVRIFMVNSKSVAVARVPTPDGVVKYEGTAVIDGVPGAAAPVPLAFEGIAGATCGALLPTGSVVDRVNGIDVTVIDNGMPVIILAAATVGKTGYEAPAELEADAELSQCIEAIRIQLGEALKLGNVANKTVPKVSLVAPARRGGAICTRTFIPHRVHEAIGVLGAVSVASACVIDGSVCDGIAAKLDEDRATASLDIEHPSGAFTVELDFTGRGNNTAIHRTALLRTARKLMDGHAYVDEELWSGGT